MKPIKPQYLVACDLDGTLLNKQYALSEVTKNYLHKLQQQYPEVIFCLVTGRTPLSSQPFYQALNLNSLIVCCNGAIISDYLHPPHLISFELSKLHHLFQDQFVRSQINTINLTTTSQEWEILNLSDLDRVCNQLNHLVGERGLYVRIQFANKTYANQILTIFKTKVPELVINFWEYLDRDYFYVELQSKACNKKTGVEYLAHYYQIKPQNVFTFGDNVNDLSMLEHDQWKTYAMSNGISYVRVLAHNITEFSHDQDGVVKTLSKFFPIN